MIYTSQLLKQRRCIYTPAPKLHNLSPTEFADLVLIASAIIMATTLIFHFSSSRPAPVEAYQTQTYY
ncbi:hypothetical protein A2899_01075 [Candidatus Amesbacteria bacterium RIFCSPLOWO2_01_FULL_49_25]|nr:MAG: hypothetical protein A2899_01075 [Candidatus Amesbacteria bacterium RIFCSPLOWO2_01_FULL_49_25]